jgi:hypothetical protein
VTPAREPNGRALVGATEVIVAIITTFGVVAAAAIATLVPVLAAKNAAPVSTLPRRLRPTTGAATRCRSAIAITGTVTA